MQMVLGFASIIGIAPAMILMYLVLRKYTYPAVEKPFFSDPYFFGLFVVGMISGTILFAVYTYFWGNAIISALLFGVLEVMVILVILNLRRFHGKSDTVFYGYGLGLGFGATMAVGMSYYLISVSSSAGEALGALDYVILVILTISKTMLLSAAGLTVGEGVAKLRILEFTSQAVLVNMIYHIVMVPWFSNPGQWIGTLSLFLGLIIAIAYFYKTAFSDLPNVVRAVLRQEGSKRGDVPK